MDLEQARKQADFDLEQKKIALTEAEVSLRRLQNKYNELKADREMASFKAPENGILLYGGYVADKWVAIPVAEKLKPGGKLGAFDKIATIVPPDTRTRSSRLLFRTPPLRPRWGKPSSSK